MRAFFPLLFVCLFVCVNGHGFMSVPASRNLQDRRSQIEWCPHCLSGGGPAVVRQLAGGVWRSDDAALDNRRSGLCGDRKDSPSPKYNPRTKVEISATYSPGSTITIESEITTNHAGYIEVKLCDVSTLSDETTVTQECFNQYPLPRDPSDTGTGDYPSPPLANYPTRMYVKPSCVGEKNGLYGGQVMKFKVRLPDKLMPRAVVQWRYVTGNSCNDEGWEDFVAVRAADPAGCTNGYSGIPRCGEGDAYPEEFWNCADIAISNSAGGPTVPDPNPSRGSASPVATVDPGAGRKCVSISHVTDSWCESVKCPARFSMYCEWSSGGGGAATGGGAGGGGGSTGGDMTCSEHKTKCQERCLKLAGGVTTNQCWNEPHDTYVKCQCSDGSVLKIANAPKCKHSSCEC